MKLNKILALALTGVMAVSMLAGCGNKDTGNGDGEVVVTPVTGAASILNDEQDKVEFTNVSSADLQKATSTLTTAELEALEPTIKAEETNGKIVSILKDLSEDDDDFTNTYGVFQGKNDPDEKTTAIVVFGVSGALTMDAAVEKIADDLDASLALAATVNRKTYVYSYTGTVSTVTATSVDGKVSGHYIMLTITQSVKDAL